MTAKVLSVEGDRDGIRWGSIRFLGADAGEAQRRYQFDRLSGAVSLWQFVVTSQHQTFVRDTDAHRLEAARAALLARIGTIG